MFAAYKDRADVVVLYIREAHPTDGRQSQANVREGILIKDPRAVEERRQVARQFASQFKVSLPIFVDTMDDRVGRAYTAAPDRIYVVDARGHVAYKGGPGPRGFRVSDVPPVLDRLLGTKLAATFPPEPPSVKPADPPSEPPGSPAEVRQRLAAMLRRLDVGEKEAGQVVRAMEKRHQAHRGLMEARGGLMHAARSGDGAEKALAAYEQARAKYDEEVRKIDQELDAAVGFSKKPALRAALTAMGLVGTSPAPPLSGMMTGPGGRPRRP